MRTWYVFMASVRCHPAFYFLSANKACAGDLLLFLANGYQHCSASALHLLSQISSCVAVSEILERF